MPSYGSNHKGTLPQPQTDSGIATAQILTLITSALSFALIPIFIVTAYLYDLFKKKLRQLRRRRVEPEPENTLTQRTESIKSIRKRSAVEFYPVDETTSNKEKKKKKIVFDQEAELGLETESASQSGNPIKTEQVSVQNKKSNFVVQGRMAKTQKVPTEITNLRNVKSQKIEMPAVVVHQSKSNRHRQSLRNLQLELQDNSFFNVNIDDDDDVESQTWLIPDFNIETPNPSPTSRYTPRSFISSTMTIDKSSSPIVDSFPTLFAVQNESSKPNQSSPPDDIRKARLLNPNKKSPIAAPRVPSALVKSVTTGTETQDPATLSSLIESKYDSKKSIKSIGLKTISPTSLSTSCNTENPIKTTDVGILQQISTTAAETESESTPVTNDECIETENFQVPKTNKDESIETKLEPTKKLLLETKTGTENRDIKDEYVQALNPCTDNKIEHTQTFQPAPPMIPPRAAKKSSTLIQTDEIHSTTESIQTPRQAKIPPHPPPIPIRQKLKSSCETQTLESEKHEEETLPVSTSTLLLLQSESVNTETADTKVNTRIEVKEQGSDSGIETLTENLQTDQDQTFSTNSATKMANLQQWIFPPVSIIPIQSLDDENADSDAVIPLQLKESNGFLPSISYTQHPQILPTERCSKVIEIKSNSPENCNNEFLQVVQQIQQNGEEEEEGGIEENKPEIIPEEPWEFQTHDYNYSNIDELEEVTTTATPTVIHLEMESKLENSPCTPTTVDLEQEIRPKAADSMLLLISSQVEKQKDKQKMVQNFTKECEKSYETEKLVAEEEEESSPADNELNKVFKRAVRKIESLELNQDFPIDTSNIVGTQSTSIINVPTSCSPVNLESPFYSRTISTSKSMHETGTTKRVETINKKTNTTTRNNNDIGCSDREYAKIKFLKEQDELNIRMKWLRNEEELMIDRTAGILAYYSLDKASIQMKLHPNENHRYQADDDSTKLDCEKLYNSVCTSCVQPSSNNNISSSSKNLTNYKPQVKLKSEIINDKAATSTTTTTSNTSNYFDYLKNRKRKKGW